jgi:hypothetical protein
VRLIFLHVLFQSCEVRTILHVQGTVASAAYSYLAQKRRFERYQYALKVLERPMDFTGNDTFNLDRSKSPWPKDEAELNALWDSKVKYDQPKSAA